MEKIKTPLGQLLEIINHRVEELNNKRESCNNFTDEDFIDEYNSVLSELAKIKEQIIILFPVQQYIIQKTYIQACHDSQNFDMDLSDDDSLKEYASDEFTQTFESYE